MWIFLCSYRTNKHKMYFYKYSKLWQTTCTLQNCSSLHEWRPGGSSGKVDCFRNLHSCLHLQQSRGYLNVSVNSKQKKNRVRIHFCWVRTLFNVSVNSKPDHPLPGRSPGIRIFSLPKESGFRPTIFAGREGVGVLNQRNFLQSWKKMQELLDLFQTNRWQLVKQVLLCCFIWISAKTAHVYCIFDNIDYFRIFWWNFQVFQGSSLLMRDHHYWIACYC